MARGVRGAGLLGSPLAGVAPLLRSPRFEVFPAGGVEDAVGEWLPAGRTVTVTASPAKGLDATLDLTERLAGRGYRVVPHISARLERLAEMGNPFARTGITGYPESHPRIEDDITIQAMWDKRRHASYIVSNLCFDPVTLRRWILRIRARSVTLPLYAGLAGPVERARLLRMAAKAGAAESARFLAGHTEWFLRMGTPGGYNPDKLLSRMAATFSSPAAAVEGLHLFTFNQVQQTEQWRQALLARLGG